MLTGPTLPLDVVATMFSAVMVASGLVFALSVAFIAVLVLTRLPAEEGELFHIGASRSDRRHAA